MVTPVSVRAAPVPNCTSYGSPPTGLVIGVAVSEAVGADGPEAPVEEFHAANEPPATEGEEVVLKFRVPGNDRVLEVQAIVVYVNRNQKHPVHSLPPGAGLRFRNLSVPDSRLIVGTIRAYCMSNPVYRQYL